MNQGQRTNGKVVSAVEVNYEALQMAICRGITEGNQVLISNLNTSGDRRHELRNQFETTQLRLYDHDAELKLLKGIAMTLLGTGDGSGGIVNRLNNEVSDLGNKVNELASEMRLMKSQMASFESAVRDLSTNVKNHQTFVSGWKGVGVAAGIIGSCGALIVKLIVDVVQHTGH